MCGPHHGAGFLAGAYSPDNNTSHNNFGWDNKNSIRNPRHIHPSIPRRVMSFSSQRCRAAGSSQCARSSGMVGCPLKYRPDMYRNGRTCRITAIKFGTRSSCGRSCVPRAALKPRLRRKFSCTASSGSCSRANRVTCSADLLPPVASRRPRNGRTVNSTFSSCTVQCELHRETRTINTRPVSRCSQAHR